MQPRTGWKWIMAATATAAVAIVFVACGKPALTAEEQPVEAHRGSREAPVLVELFTSQGCSSCPPADRLLGRLAADRDGAGSGVIPLSYHVDYWNYIGWTDPFSSEQWSNRQRRYAQAFSSGRIYTPQLVVDGASDCVGSDVDEVREKISRASHSDAAGELELSVLSGDGPLALRLDVTARVRRPDGRRWDVMAAVFENQLVTAVQRGENAGRSLSNENVVRQLTEAFSIPVRAGAEQTESFEIRLDKGWNRDNLGVAVFLQDPSTMRIHGAAVQYL